MAITKEIKQGKIIITSLMEFVIEQITIIKDNGVEVLRSKAIAEIVTPLDDVKDKSDKIKKLSKILHTKAVKDKYKKAINIKV